MLLGYPLLVRPGLREDDAKAGFRVFSDSMSASALDVNTLQLGSLLNPCLCCTDGNILSTSARRTSNN